MLLFTVFKGTMTFIGVMVEIWVIGIKLNQICIQVVFSSGSLLLRCSLRLSPLAPAPSLAQLQLWSLDPNKLQGLGICHLINYTPIIFSPKLIRIDWSSPKLWNDFRNQSVSKMKMKVLLIKVLLLISYSLIKKKELDKLR